MCLWECARGRISTVDQETMRKKGERGGKGHHHTYRRRVSLRANALLQNMHAKLRSFKWTCARRNGQHDTGMYMEGFIRY